MRAWGSTGAPEREEGWTTRGEAPAGGDVKLWLLWLLLCPLPLPSAAAASGRVVVAVAAGTSEAAVAKVGERESDDGVSWVCGPSPCGGWAWCCCWW